MFFILFVFWAALFYGVKALITRRNPFVSRSKHLTPDDLYLEPWETEEDLQWRKQKLAEKMPQ